MIDFSLSILSPTPTSEPWWSKGMDVVQEGMKVAGAAIQGRYLVEAVATGAEPILALKDIQEKGGFPVKIEVSPMILLLGGALVLVLLLR